MIYVLIAGTSGTVKKFAISKGITSTPDNASFTLETDTLVPSIGQDVKIYKDTTDTMLFAGTIISFKKQILSPSSLASGRTYSYSVECQDYGHLLDRYLVNNSYVSQTCKQIIEHIVANYTDPAIGFTTNNVSTGRTITKINFSYKTVSEAFQELAQLLEFEWYVDSDKDIHFFEKETLSAPFEINDEALQNKIFDFNLEPDYSQVRNRVFVRGSYYLSGDYTENIVCDGETRAWNVAFKPHDLTSVTLDTVAKTSAVDHLSDDDGTYEFFWNYAEQYIRCADNVGTQITPVAGTVLSFTYNYEIPIIIRADNEESQTAIGTIEGGTGIYESVIKDETISTREEARNRAKAEVNTFGNALIYGEFSTLEDGFDVGQFITFSASDFSDYHGNYQIKSISIIPIGNNVIVYSIYFATTLYELKDLLLSLIREKNSFYVREDEQVDVLKMIEEEINITDDTFIITQNSHPVKWNQFIWGLATWGNRNEFDAGFDDSFA